VRLQGDAGTAIPSGTIPLFVAQVFGALTVVSCEDGRTWKKVRQENSINDEHFESSSQGLAYGDGTFMSVFGWGATNTVWSSTDGQAWARSYGTGSFESMGDVAFGRGVFLAGGNRWASDKGKTWKVTRGDGSLRTFFVDYGPGPGRFLIADSSVNYTDHLGATWKPATRSLQFASNRGSEQPTAHSTQNVLKVLK